MQTFQWIRCGTAAALLAGAVAASDIDQTLKTIDEVARRGPFQPTWESLAGYRVPEWYVDAKFGIFIHWGVYSVPAFGNEWYPREMYNASGSRRGIYEHHLKT
ncbi:MAG: hypothetical protein D6766_05045, partial [Verrucomicrobia bacterium]